MAMVRCAECKNWISNKTVKCLYCGYAPMGICKNCIYYENFCNFEGGFCRAANNEYVKKYKSVCPGVVKKLFF